MQRLVLAASCVAGALAASPALGQDDAAPAESGRKTGLYARGAGGLSAAGDWDQDLTFNPALGGSFPTNCGYPVPPSTVVCSFVVTAVPTSQSLENGSGATWSAAIGYQYARTRTELEYRWARTDIDAAAVNGVPTTFFPNDQLTAQFLFSNVYFDLVNRSRFTPYVGVGVGGARVANQLGERDAAFAYQGRAGVEFRVMPSVSIGAEYVYARTLELSFGPDEFEPTGPDGPRADGSPYISSSVMGTVRWVF